MYKEKCEKYKTVCYIYYLVVQNRCRQVFNPTSTKRTVQFTEKV